MAMPDTVDKIKTFLRISHNELDEELNDEIEATLKNLVRLGVKNCDETDPIILSLIKADMKAKYSNDSKDAEIFRARVEQLTAGLSMSTGYGVLGDD